MVFLGVVRPKEQSKNLESNEEIQIDEESNEENVVATCGGSIINESFVLGAAHCFWKPFKRVEVYVGQYQFPHSADDNDKRIAVDINQVYLHPKYNYETDFHDIAILKLPIKITFGVGDFKNISPICLPQPGKDIDKNDCRVVGFGNIDETNNNQRIKPKNLMQATVPIVDDSECHFRDYHTGTNICAGFNDSPRRPDTCRGDSGGPLQCHPKGRANEWFLIGLTSYGGGCRKNETRTPAVYTKVGFYTDPTHDDWVLEMLRNPHHQQRPTTASPESLIDNQRKQPEYIYESELTRQPKKS